MLHRYILALLLLSALSAVSPLLAQQSGGSDGALPPLERFLNPDGTVNLRSGYNGAVDPTGWNMLSGSSNGAPRFVPSASSAAAEGDEYWDARFGPPGTNGTVHALLVVDGTLYVGGRFTSAGNVLANNIARWNGSTWSAVGSGAGGPVYALAAKGGSLYVGGQFASAGGAAAKGIARLELATGFWTPLGEGIYAGFTPRTTVSLGRVYSIVIDGNDIYVAGFFYRAGTANANNVARWNLQSRTWSPIGSGLGSGALPVYSLVKVGAELFAGGGFPGWLSRFNGTEWTTVSPGVNDTVYALAASGNTLHVGGRFTRAGALTAGNLARLDVSTGAWSAVGSAIDGPVYSLADIDGDLYAGGGFSRIGTLDASSIARYNGNTWEALGAGVGDSATPAVRSIASYAGQIFAGGTFRVAGTVTAHNIATWDGSDWRALGAGVDGTNRNGVDGAVFAVAIKGEEVYVGGDFSRAGGVEARSVARWDGFEWRPLGSGIGGASPFVRALAVTADGTLYVGGIFSSAGGSPVSGIAAWNGSVWSGLGGGVGGSTPYVFALAADGNAVYAAGAFTTAGGVPAARVARWSAGAWSALGSGITGDSTEYSYVNAITVNGSVVTVGGSFARAGAGAARNIAQWSGSAWRALGDGLDATVNAVVASGSDIYAAGEFTGSGDILLGRVARWDGTRWAPLGSGISGTVFALALRDGILHAGGRFTLAGGGFAANIARWDGSAWSRVGAGTNGSVNAIAASPADLYVGGAFSIADGRKANNIARWDGSGFSALGSDPTSGLFGTVLAITLHRGGIYVGGKFSTAGGVLANGIVEWTGTGWRALGRGVAGPVRAIVAVDDDIYAGGEFLTAAGIASPGIARWSITERRWFDVAGGMGGSSPYVFALASHGEDIYAGGSFITAGGLTVNRIARYNRSSHAWSALGSGITGGGYYTYVSSIALAPDGTLYAGGLFPTAGGVRLNNVARWDGSQWSEMGHGLNSIVYDLTVAEGFIYAGGEFTASGPYPMKFIARFDAGDWRPMGAGLDQPAYSLASYKNMVYVGGTFLIVDITLANSVARWNGNVWSGLGSGVSGSYDLGQVYAIAVDDSAVYVGGSFTRAGGSPSYNYASWRGPLVTSVPSERPAGTTALLLGEPIPNPTEGHATLPIRAVRDARYRVELYSSRGERVTTLLDGHLAPGEHRIDIDAAGLAAGIYFIRINGGGAEASRAIQVVR